MEFWFPVNIYEVKFLCHWFGFKATHDAKYLQNLSKDLPGYDQHKLGFYDKTTTRGVTAKKGQNN